MNFGFTHNKGQMALLMLVFLGLVMAAGVSLTGYTGIHVRKLGQTAQKEQTGALADAGVNRAIGGLFTDPNFTGGTFDLGGGQVSTTVATVASNRKRVTVKSAIPTLQNPERQTEVQVDLLTSEASISAAFDYAMQASFGGITMGQNSSVSGSVYSNGSIIGATGAKITRNAIIADNLPNTTLLEQTSIPNDILAGRTSSQEDWVQSFSLPTTGKVLKIQIYWNHTGSPNPITFGIASDNSGAPGSLLVSKTVTHAEMPDYYAWFEITFGTELLLTANTQYWLVINAPGVSTSNYYNFKGGAGSSYAGGTAKHGTEWTASLTDSQQDIAFRIVQGSTNTLQTVTVGANNVGDATAPTIHNSTVAHNATATTLTNTTVGYDAVVGTASNCAVGHNMTYSTSVLGCSVAGQTSQGQAPTMVSSLPMPVDDDDIALFKSKAQEGGQHSGDYGVNNGEEGELGPLEITGDLNIGTNGTLILNGAIHVRGDLNFENGCTIELGEGYDSNESGVIIVDGKINLDNNCSFVSSGTGYPILISTDTSQNSGAPSIDIANSAEGAVFYAPYGTVKLGNADVTTLAAYKIVLQNNAEVEYGNNLSNLLISSGGGSTWVRDDSSYKIIR